MTTYIFMTNIALKDMDRKISNSILHSWKQTVMQGAICNAFTYS